MPLSLATALLIHQHQFILSTLLLFFFFEIVFSVRQVRSRMDENKAAATAVSR